MKDDMGDDMKDNMKDERFTMIYLKKLSIYLSKDNTNNEGCYEG